MEYVWTELSLQINDLQRQIDAIKAQDVAGAAFDFIESDLADAPLAINGMTNAALRWISDGRKSGEGAGTGTGVVAFYNPATDTWKRMDDFSDVII